MAELVTGPGVLWYQLDNRVSIIAKRGGGGLLRAFPVTASGNVAPRRPGLSGCWEKCFAGCVMAAGGGGALGRWWGSRACFASGRRNPLVARVDSPTKQEEDGLEMGSGGIHEQRKVYRFWLVFVEWGVTDTIFAGRDHKFRAMLHVITNSHQPHRYLGPKAQ